MYTKDIRDSFLSFFEKKGHQIVPSSPLVPQNDPTLMFTNAGMVQFKNVFTGLETRPYARAVTAQKCVRAGGKHNDLENVGHTARHHTFFEMLGNFSFGDYFKEEAIHYAWHYLTKTLDISPNKLYITVYHDDQDAYRIWKKLTGFSDEKVIKISTSDNFWAMGDTGPCGPCTEIFYDHGEHIAGGLPGTPEEDGDRFVEIWNLVFMQYERHASGEQTSLPKPSVDTGMGIERIAAVMQGVNNNYETDVLKSLVSRVAEQTKTEMNGSHLVSQRVIADHLRSACFLIADGVLPSNEGRGYVLRRIMRRAMRHAYLLQAKDPLLCQLVPMLVEKMGHAFDELNRAKDLITLTLRLEEEKFKDAFTRGIRVLEEELKQTQNKQFSGLAAFKLYDTYGFPLDLTEDILKDRHLEVNKDEFNDAMAQQKKLARASWAGSGEKTAETIWFDLKEKCGPTEFIGYRFSEGEGTVSALSKDGTIVDRLEKGDQGFLIANQTPFYGESGGQMGDTGNLVNSSVRAHVLNTHKKVDGLIVHEVRVDKGTLEVGQTLHFKIDVNRREKLRANHSATHLLHEVLRRKLGNSVTQKGSLVAPDRLRFDFSYHTSISAKDLRSIEGEMNRQIRGNALVSTEVSTPEAAIKKGAQALFGEKYGDEVRVVSMGKTDDMFSVELCGGTHVERLGDIGYFKILSESSVSSGVRRIEAVTGVDAESYAAKQEDIIESIAQALKTPLPRLKDKVSQLLTEKKALEKKVQDLQTAPQSNAGNTNTLEADGTKILIHETDKVEPKGLRPLMDKLKQELKSGIVVLYAEYEGKSSLLVGVTEDKVKEHDARDILKTVSEKAGIQSGGGRKDLAQSGGRLSDVNAVIKDVFSC